MLRLLSWSSGLAADKIMAPEMNYLVPPPQHITSTIALQKPATLKRKRVNTSPLDIPPEPSKRRMEVGSPALAAPKLTSLDLPSAVASSTKSGQTLPPCSLLHAQGLPKLDDPRPTKPEQADAQARPDKGSLRQILDSQIGLEILLKHNELRLIDQEMAKCQIALEQLRRCTEIPFPVIRPSESVSQGRGPAVRSSRSATQAEAPAPWGVTDGPYSRHYAKWLLPDPLFDDGEEVASETKTASKNLCGKAPANSRSTRGSFVDFGSAAGKARAQRAGKFQALSSGYPQPKDKSGPMIQKRKSDGVLVKLICLDCRRDNFSSAQGFINHCRIAHGRNFASHDSAADACGEPVDVDEAGAAVASETSGTLSAGLVHPLIYSAHLRVPEAVRKRPASESPSMRAMSIRSPSECRPVRISEQMSTNDLTPSPVTPHLSALLQKTGAKLDLQSLVADTRTPVPIDEPSESDGEEEDTDLSQYLAHGRHPHVARTMQPTRSVTSDITSDERLGSRKGLNCPRGLELAPSSSMTTNTQAILNGIPVVPYVPAAHGDEIEPSPTNESNQAPSLVDDDGDDDCEVHSPFYPGWGSSDGENRDVAVDIEDGDESGPSTRDPAPDSDFSGTPKKDPTPTASHRTSAFRRSIGAREEKHVSFLSPSPGRDADSNSPRRSGDCRKRRMGAG